MTRAGPEQTFIVLKISLGNWGRVPAEHFNMVPHDGLVPIFLLSRSCETDHIMASFSHAQLFMNVRAPIYLMHKGLYAKPQVCRNVMFTLSGISEGSFGKCPITATPTSILPQAGKQTGRQAGRKTKEGCQICRCLPPPSCLPV